MTIPVSTVPAVVGYLYDTIKTVIDDPAVLVSYGPPGPNQPDDMIIVNGVSRELVPYQMVASGGAGWLDESYTVDVIVSVYRGGDSARLVMERACTLVDQVVAVIRTDPSLDGQVVVAHPAFVQYDPSFDQDHKGRLVDATIAVSVRARI